MDIEKTLQFLLEWQAAFSASLDQMKEEAGRRAAEADRRAAEAGRRAATIDAILDRSAGQIVAINDHILELIDTMDHILTVQQHHDDWLSKLTDSQLRLEAVQTKLAEAETRNADAIGGILGRLPKQ
jgi:hypothetical protein